MGLHDYEHLSSTIYPSKSSTGEERTFIDVITKNSNWRAEVCPCVYKNDPFADILNRPVFKATKLREELFFIKCQIYNEDNEINEFTFVVNEYSIYKRFRIYKDDSNMFFTKNEMDLTKYIQHLKLNDYRISIRLFNNEREELDAILANIPNAYKYYENWKLKSGNVVKIVGIQHYNKRTWIYLLTENNVENLDLDYKNSKSDAFYDNNFAKKYN